LPDASALLTVTPASAILHTSKFNLAAGLEDLAARLEGLAAGLEDLAARLEGLAAGLEDLAESAS
jgi:methyl-accepting chemotaxis protein